MSENGIFVFDIYGLGTQLSWKSTERDARQSSLNGVGENVCEKSEFKVELRWLSRGGWKHTCNYFHKNLWYVGFYFWKKNTVYLDTCAFHLLKQKSSARWFSPSAQLFLMWHASLGRHGVMASATYRFSKYS